MLTESEKLENIECLKVLMEGGTVEWLRDDRSWKQTTNAICINDTPHRRIPAPVDRPWAKPSDVPRPTCWLRMKGDTIEEMIIHIACGGVRVSTGVLHFHKMEHFEHSTDCQAWKPCRTTLP